MSSTLLSRVLLTAAICAWLITLALLIAWPAASLDTVRGLYASESGNGLTYRWSGDRVVIPIARQSGSTDLTLGLSAMRWADRAAPRLVLHSASGELDSFTAPDAPRRYHLLLPPDTTELIIESTVDRGPGQDSRWLGFALFSLSARSGGLPVGMLSLSLVLLPIYLFIAWALAWAIRRGVGMHLVLFGLALALRTIQLEITPPGWRVDEAVSLVDAWNVARTGHDHLGHLLPIGAFEALGDWISPLLTYLELPFVAFFGPQPLVGRLITATVGALGAPLGYALARALGLRRVGAIAAGLAVALSPWQIFMSRTALPPALVPTFWTLSLLAGVNFIRRHDRRSALGLALAAGVTLYAYPTLKLAAPLLVALAVGLILLKRALESRVATYRVALTPALSQGERESPAPIGSGIGSKDSRKLLALIILLLGLLWSPFAQVTLFNPASATRLNQAALRAGSWGEWLSAWWSGYSVYFWPDFYYRFGDGSSTRGVPGFGVELWAGLPLLLLGLAGLIISVVRWPSSPSPLSRARERGDSARSGAVNHSVWERGEAALLPIPVAIFILGALLIAALPASLTLPSPHIYRAAPLAPLYALLVGYGVALLLPQSGGKIGDGLQQRARQLIALALAGALLWQSASWWRAYTQDYPTLQAGLNQDGLAETMRRAVALAPQYDEIWVSYDSIDEPYIFVLAAQPFPPDYAQQLITVERRPGHFNTITRIGPYRFVDTSDLPAGLPPRVAVPGAMGGKGYVAQEWSNEGKRILVVRRM